VTTTTNTGGGMYLNAGVILDDDTEIKVAGSGIPAVRLAGPGMGGFLSLQLAAGADERAVADRLLAAVQTWRDEIHRRASGAEQERHRDAEEVVAAVHARGELPPLAGRLERAKEGDPDPVPHATGGRRCEQAAPGRAVCCVRRQGHRGQHIASDGATVVAAWPAGE
jgi:hypothetical protein